MGSNSTWEKGVWFCPGPATSDMSAEPVAWMAGQVSRLIFYSLCRRIYVSYVNAGHKFRIGQFETVQPPPSLTFDVNADPLD